MGTTNQKSFEMADQGSDGTSSAPQKTPKSGLSEVFVTANQELRASIVSNVITKGLVGLGVGVGLALFVFKRIRSYTIFMSLGKAAPVMFTTGFGLGMSYAEGSQMVRDHHEALRRKALGDVPLHRQTPPGFQ